MYVLLIIQLCCTNEVDAGETRLLTRPAKRFKRAMACRVLRASVHPVSQPQMWCIEVMKCAVDANYMPTLGSQIDNPEIFFIGRVSAERTFKRRRPRSREKGAHTTFVKVCRMAA